jgi:hypothetical protein
MPEPKGGPAPQIVTVPQPNPAPKPMIQNQPSVVSCAPEQPAIRTNQIVAANTTNAAAVNRKKFQTFVFWSNTPFNGTDDIIITVLGAVESSGGVIKSNLTIKETNFR